MGEEVVISLKIDHFLGFFALADVSGGAVGAQEIFPRALIAVRVYSHGGEFHPHRPRMK